VRLHLAQDSGQALDSPDRVRLVGAERPGAGFGKLAEAGSGATQVSELFEVPREVADSPQRGGMFVAEHLPTALE